MQPNSAMCRRNVCPQNEVIRFRLGSLQSLDRKLATMILGLLGHAHRLAMILGLCFLAGTAISAGAADSETQPQNTNALVTARSGEEGYPILLDGEVVLRVKSAIGAITAEQRAQLAQQRLLRIATDPFYSPELFRATTEDGTAYVYYRDEIVGTLTKTDIAATGLSPQDAAARLVSKVTEAITHYRESRTPRRWFQAVLLLAGATLLALLLIRLTHWWHGKIGEKIQASESRLAQKFNRRLGVTPERIKEYRERALGLLRATIMILIGLLWLEAAFSVFPITRGFARTVLSYLLRPVSTLWESFLLHIGDLFFVFMVVVLTHYSLKCLRWLAREIKRGVITLPGVEPQSALPLYKITRLVVIAFAAVVAYPYIPGSSSAAFKGISLFAGALFTLGASGAAGNFIGGVVLVFMGHYRVGDRIRLGEVSGDVVEVTLLVTRILTPKNEVVSLPNAAVMGGQLVNYSTRAKQEGVILHTAVSIGYDVAWRQVHELLLAAARKTEGVLETPAPFVLQTALGDFYVNYELNAYTRQPNGMSTIYSHLHQNILDEFNNAGVQIMSPHYFSDPAEPKLSPPDRRQATDSAAKPKA